MSDQGTTPPADSDVGTGEKTPPDDVTPAQPAEEQAPEAGEPDQFSRESKEANYEADRQRLAEESQ